MFIGAIQDEPIDYSTLSDAMFASEEQFFALLLKPFLIGAVAGFIYTVINSRLSGVPFKFTEVVVIIPVILIAYVAGYLTGISGSSAVGNLVPSALAFIGGLNVYMFGTKSNYKSLVIVSIFLFSMTLFYGVLDGRTDRTNQLEEQMDASAVKELSIRNFRQNLSLPPDPPSWMTSGP